MNHEQWIKLTPEQQRIRIAELCGWKERKTKDPKAYNPLIMVSPKSDMIFSCLIPDYLNDLNAMAEAEKMILHKDNTWEASTYRLYLARLEAIAAPANMVFATAAQRAEALILTMEPVGERWQDDAEDGGEYMRHRPL